MNRELGAGFALDRFSHCAIFSESSHSIEMHLRSTQNQVIAIPGANVDVPFDQGETIWTEASHKYSLEELEHLATQSGFALRATWVDKEWPFADCLWSAC